MDAAYFPHIIERILDYGVQDNAPLLRRVCKEWARLVDQRVFAHVRITTTFVGAGRSVDKVWKFWSVWNPSTLHCTSLPIKKSIRKKADPLEPLRHEAIWDFMTILDVPVYLDTVREGFEFIDALPKLHTARLSADAQFHNIEALSHVERVIVGHPNNRLTGRVIYSACSEKRCRRMHTRKLVLNQLRPDWILEQGGFDIHKLKDLKEIVIIFHPWGPRSWEMGRPRLTACHIAAHALTLRVKVTVVNIRQLGFDSDVPLVPYPPHTPETFTKAVRSGISERSPSARPNDLLKLLHFRSAQEYIHEVGRDEFKLEAMLTWQDLDI